MYSLLKDDISFFDINFQNVHIECRRLDLSEKPLELAAAFDCLGFVTGGSGGVKLDKKSYANLQRGSVFYMPKGVKAAAWSSKEQEPFEIYSVIIDVFAGAKFFASLGFSEPGSVQFLKGKMSIVEELFSTAQTNSLFGTYKCLSLLFEIFSLLADCSKEVESKEDKNKYVMRATHYIHTQYYEDINVNKIADVLHINRSYLTMLFKKTLGVTPGEYLINYRIKLACKLLGMDKSVTDVAMLTGFNSIGNFNLQFKRIKKMTPSEYKNQLKSQGKKE